MSVLSREVSLYPSDTIRSLSLNMQLGVSYGCLHWLISSLTSLHLRFRLWTIFSFTSPWYMLQLDLPCIQAMTRWGYYPLILIASWAFGTINKIHNLIFPEDAVFWLYCLHIGTAALMVR